MMISFIIILNNSLPETIVQSKAVITGEKERFGKKVLSSLSYVLYDPSSLTGPE